MCRSWRHPHRCRKPAQWDVIVGREIQSLDARFAKVGETIDDVEVAEGAGRSRVVRNLGNVDEDFAIDARDGARRNTPAAHQDQRIEVAQLDRRTPGRALVVLELFKYFVSKHHKTVVVIGIGVKRGWPGVDRLRRIDDAFGSDDEDAFGSRVVCHCACAGAGRDRLFQTIMVGIVLMEDRDISLDAIGRDDPVMFPVIGHAIVAAPEAECRDDRAAVGVHHGEHRLRSAATDEGAMVGAIIGQTGRRGAAGGRPLGRAPRARGIDRRDHVAIAFVEQDRPSPVGNRGLGLLRFEIDMADHGQAARVHEGDAATASAGLLLTVLFASAVIGIALARVILRPLTFIRKTAARIGSDNLSERIPPPRHDDELARLENSFNRIKLYRKSNTFTSATSTSSKHGQTMLHISLRHAVMI